MRAGEGAGRGGSVVGAEGDAGDPSGSITGSVPLGIVPACCLLSPGTTLIVAIASCSTRMTGRSTGPGAMSNREDS
jgi:hypothetical protein